MIEHLLRLTMNAGLNINLIPASRRARRRRDCIRRSVRLCALCLTLIAVMWIACYRNGASGSRGPSATSQVSALQDLAMHASASH